MTELLDVAIIGAGSAGLAALREVRKRTERFVLINDGPYGTTCARVGCMPSKTLIEAANAFHRRRSFEAFGIRGANTLTIDVPAVLRRVRMLRDDFVSGTLKATQDLGERSIAGRARLLGPQMISVDGREIRSRKIIVATGSRPVVPDAWKSFGNRIFTTDTLFEKEDLPSRVAVIGMGAIGAELSQALSRLGINVCCFGKPKVLAGITDERIRETFAALLRDELALYQDGPAVLSLADDGIRVSNGKIEVVVDEVLAALGRRPNIEGLGLEALGVALDENGMPSIDPTTMQIADLPVFFAGDASGHGVLHEAADEGHIAGLNALGGDRRSFKRRTSLAIVFADPNVAVVGKRFAALDKSTTLVGEVNFAHQGRARTAQQNKGVMHIYAQQGTGLLLGAEMCAPAAEHLAHILALAIERSLTVRDLLRMPFYHPVLEEGMRTALRELASQLPKCSDSDLAACGAYNIGALD